jgi:hypothetical protein
VAERSTTMDVWLGVSSDVVEVVWVSTKACSGLRQIVSEHRCMTALALVDSCWFLS